MSHDDAEARRPDPVGGGADEPSVWVEFPGFDVEQLRTTQQWDDALVREAQLMVRGDPDGVRTDLEELRSDLERARAAVTNLRPALEQGLQAALGAGRTADELVLVVDRATVEMAEEADAAFRRLDGHCGGAMLLSPLPESASGFRRWFLAQFREQAAGRPAESWADWWSRNGQAPSGTDDVPLGDDPGPVRSAG